MEQSILILGRQPALGIAEAESLFGAARLQQLTVGAVRVDTPYTAINFSRLGGSTRLCQLLTTLPYTDWQRVADYMTSDLNEHISELPEGKIRLGLSVIGKGPSIKAINATGLSLKKAVKGAGRSVRVVPNNAPELNTAQVLHNQLTGPTGYELVVILQKNQTVLARTVQVQDINAYAARDQKRPKRDARVGMLPPKLAQIITNLAVSQTEPNQNTVVLDPFCGTGVVLQEALLSGYRVYGTDLDKRMVEYSLENIKWLEGAKQCPYNYAIEEGDATAHHWQQPIDFVACETYLGRPLATLPSPDKLQQIMSDCDTIHQKFLANLAAQTPSGFRACLAVPAWKTQSGFKHLKTLDNLAHLGYNRLRFVHADTGDLIYHRPDQLVARELVILQRI